VTAAANQPAYVPVVAPRTPSAANNIPATAPHNSVNPLWVAVWVLIALVVGLVAALIWSLTRRAKRTMSSPMASDPQESRMPGAVVASTEGAKLSPWLVGLGTVAIVLVLFAVVGPLTQTASNPEERNTPIAAANETSGDKPNAASNAASDTTVLPDDQAPIWPVSFGTSGSGVFETVQSDIAWRAADNGGPCSRLRDRLTDSPDDEAACDAHDRQMPACINYGGFAKVWLDIRRTQPGVWAVQGQMLGDTNSNQASPNLVYHSPDYMNDLRQLLAYVGSIDEQRWTDSDKFGDYAYNICMQGDFLRASEGASSDSTQGRQEVGQ
jgi:hypothetical protein